MHHTVPPASVEQEGALERWLKSEEPPADNKGPVRVLTGKTFEEEVFKSGKDTFIKVGGRSGVGGNDGGSGTARSAADVGWPSGHVLS